MPSIPPLTSPRFPGENPDREGPSTREGLHYTTLRTQGPTVPFLPPPFSPAFHGLLENRNRYEHDAGGFPPGGPDRERPPLGLWGTPARKVVDPFFEQETTMAFRVTGIVLYVAVLLSAAPGRSLFAAQPPSLSEATQECISCHSLFTPGIVRDWRKSRHARTSVDRALARPQRERRISLAVGAGGAGPGRGVAVGCGECHLLGPASHEDTFLHQGYRVHVVVTPNDCASCHPSEVNQYRAGNKMAHAHGNLRDNSLYRKLEEAVTPGGGVEADDASGSAGGPSRATGMDTCYGCHGTRIRVSGRVEVETEMERMAFPRLEGWPNTGVGRVNPDGSLGSCSACHPRHRFSIRAARQPRACGRCHAGPDSPALPVYQQSPHGVLFASTGSSWDLDAVPWKLGEHFSAPTCATCHASLVIDPEGAVLVDRTHGYGERLWTRLFGLIYAHPQPKAPDTRPIRNHDGLPLPVTLKGETAGEFLIDSKTALARKAAMGTLCCACHSTPLVRQHFAKMEGTLREVDRALSTATAILEEGWSRGLVSRGNPFDEPQERIWVEQWLFFAHSIRYASAMGAAPDHAVFHGGWWQLRKGTRILRARLQEDGQRSSRERR